MSTLLSVVHVIYKKVDVIFLITRPSVDRDIQSVEAEFLCVLWKDKFRNREMKRLLIYLYNV